MSQKAGRTVETGAVAACDCLPEMFGVPVDDDGGEQIEASYRLRSQLDEVSV